MTDSLIENNILMTFTQGSYFFLTIILSVLFLRQYKTRIKLILGSTLAFFVLLHIKDLIMGYNHVTASISQENWVNFTDMFALPISGIFVHEAMRPNAINKRTVAIHLLPFAALFILFCIFRTEEIFDIVKITSIIYVIVLVTYSFMALRHAAEYHVSKRTCYAFIAIFIIFVVNWVISCINPSALSDMSFYLISAMLWGITCYLIEYKYKIMAVPDGGSKPATHPFKEALVQLIEKEALYLDARLSINDIARRIGTNRSYLSEYFNRECNTSFNDYINNLRIVYATSIITDETKSLDEVATASGFNSISTFRRAFEKKHGMTPSQYRKGYRNIL